MEEFCFDILTAVILIFRTSTYEMNGPIFWVSYTVNDPCLKKRSWGAVLKEISRLPNFFLRLRLIVHSCVRKLS